MPAFVAGQRWISNAEPELGIGQVVASDPRQVTLHFAMSEVDRTYSSREPPLTRVRFGAGDVVHSATGDSLRVESVREVDGLIVYQGTRDGHPAFLVESTLKNDMVFNRPEERLFAHQVDAPAWFDLRFRTLNQRAALAESPARGLLGPRVALIPHQLYIGQEVANRFAPRVLLADEVGLGKTIEAGLILHQQIVTGKAARVLVVVPRALTFQWFVEMIRRFNLQFALLDEERCREIEEDNREGDGTDLMAEDAEADGDAQSPRASTFNPFEAQQFVLCSIDLFVVHPHRTAQAAAAEFDLLVVDEAHHLAWSPSHASPEYLAVEQLARATRGVLLLTATPEQLGKTGHFARLRLLDPARFHDYGRFLEEENGYAPIVAEANRLLLDPDANAATLQRVEELLDRHGTGRVLFRNVRSSVSGFARRVLDGTPLPLPARYRARGEDADPRASLYPETTLPAEEAASWVRFDPRVTWLVDCLGALDGAKLLVICAHTATAQALEEVLRARHGFRVALFHEGMDLIARDRAAAWFAEEDRGAQVMIASEIGSEGRNFQFAHHLALFDLPANPDLLEQRIGRLDRIGQRGVVTIHVPYFTDSAQEVLYRWYHEALHLFTDTNPAAQDIYRELEDALLAHIGAAARGRESGAELEHFLARSRTRNEEQERVLAAGRDRLLELNSHRPERSARLIEAILHDEGGDDLLAYMERACELYGLDLEPLSDTAFAMTPTEGMVRHTAQSLETQQRYRFPELPDDGVRVTFDRETSLAREDLLFLSWENPLVRQALDVVTSDLLGNSSVVVVSHSGFPRGTLLVETVHVVETVAPPGLQIDRFLPPRAIRTLVDINGKDFADDTPYRDWLAQLVAFDEARLFDIIDRQTTHLRRMLATAAEHAGGKMALIRDDAARKMSRLLDGELARLTALAAVNPNVREEEIAHLRHTRGELASAIERADLRLDAIRVLIAA